MLKAVVLLVVLGAITAAPVVEVQDGLGKDLLKLAEDLGSAIAAASGPAIPVRIPVGRREVQDGLGADLVKLGKDVLQALEAVHGPILTPVGGREVQDGLGEDLLKLGKDVVDILVKTSVYPVGIYPVGKRDDTTLTTIETVIKDLIHLLFPDSGTAGTRDVQDGLGADLLKLAEDLAKVLATTTGPIGKRDDTTLTTIETVIKDLIHLLFPDSGTAGTRDVQDGLGKDLLKLGEDLLPYIIPIVTAGVGKRQDTTLTTIETVIKDLIHLLFPDSGTAGTRDDTTLTTIETVIKDLIHLLFPDSGTAGTRDVQENIVDDAIAVGKDIEALIKQAFGGGKREVQENIVDDAIAVGKDIEALIKQAFGGGKREDGQQIFEEIIKVGTAIEPIIVALIQHFVPQSGTRDVQADTVENIIKLIEELVPVVTALFKGEGGTGTREVQADTVENIIKLIEELVPVVTALFKGEGETGTREI